MKHMLQFLCFLMICSNSYAQSWKNLVPNYSFEHHDLSNWNACLNCTDDPQGCGEWLHHYEYMENYWSVVDNWTLPLQRGWCSSIWAAPVPTADLYHVSCNPFNNARSGETWGHTIEDGEYLIVKTKNELKSNKTYYIEIFQNGGGENNRVVAYNNQPVACKYNKKLIEYNANSNHNVLLKFDGANSGWTRVRGYFSPTSLKKWLSFGRNGDWDDLRIYEVQPNKCRENWYFDNTVFNYPMEVFQASNNIYIGNGVDPENGTNHIAGNVIQYASSSVILKAGNQIIIDHGTFIEGDSTKVFEISPEPCSDNLCPDELEFENQILCSEATKQIGTEGNEWGTNVHWSPSTYLDNPNSANPTFTSPGGEGAITYTIEVEYTCDASEVRFDPENPLTLTNSYTKTHKVVVQYTNSADPTATIAANNTQWDDYNFSTDLNFSDGVTEIKIEVNASPGYSKTFYKGIDYSCCDFYWELPSAWKWSSCADDIVKITAKNKCSGEETVLNLPWNKTNTPFSMPTSYPNVLTLYSYEVGEYLCFDVPSADYYEIEIIGRWHNSIYHVSGYVEGSPYCFYPVTLENKSDGTYFYTISFSDQCGRSGEHEQFFHLYHGNSNLPPHDPLASERNPELSKDSTLFLSRGDSSKIVPNNVTLVPNPAKKTVHITGMQQAFNIEIKDDKGKLVYQQRTSSNLINVENFAAGVYYVRIFNQRESFVKKLVVL